MRYSFVFIAALIACGPAPVKSTTSAERSPADVKVAAAGASVDGNAAFSEVTYDHVTNPATTDSISLTVNISNAVVRQQQPKFAGYEHVYALLPQVAADGTLTRLRWDLDYAGVKRAEAGALLGQKTDYFYGSTTQDQATMNAIASYGIEFAFDDNGAGTVSLPAPAIADQNPGEVGPGPATDAAGYELVDHSLTADSAMLSVWVQYGQQTDSGESYSSPINVKVLYDDRAQYFAGVAGIFAWDQINGTYALHGGNTTNIVISQSNSTSFNKNSGGQYEADFALSAYGEEGDSETQPSNGVFGFFSGSTWDSDSGSNYTVAF